MNFLKTNGCWNTPQTAKIVKGLCKKCNLTPVSMQEGENILDYYKRRDKVIEKYGIPVLSVDASNGEYGNVNLCKECIDKAFNQYEQSNKALKQTEGLQDSPPAA